MTATRSLVVRPPAAAGAFYPGDPGRLASTVDALLGGAVQTKLAARPRAIVVPHAGYVYSGAVAATAYATIRPFGALVRVVVAGPAHFVPLRGFAVPAAELWATPLGTVAIDDKLRRLAVEAGAETHDGPHAPEHSLEVQVPFLQRMAGPELRILPVAIGLSTPSEAADLLAALVDVADVVVISTDLSHYHDDATARRLDSRTLEAVLAREPNRIGDEAACGLFALRGVAELAARRRWTVTLLDQRTSADAGGGHNRVVGYAALTIG